MNARQIVRRLCTGQWGLQARAPRSANPGMAYQLNNLEQSTADANEDFAEMESDFMGVHRTHRQHETESKQKRDRVRQYMIKHKYFRDVKLPNLLLYSEKEQIRLLHQRDPDEWNIERLSESFPATPEIVRKILRSKWRPQNAERIRSHDAGVMRNWTELRAGKCNDIPSGLLEHLQKFAQRKPEDLQQFSPEKWPTRPELPVPQINEFRALLGNGNGTDTKLAIESGNKSQLGSTPGEEETFLLDKVTDKRKMRLQDLKKMNKLPEQKQEVDIERPLFNPGGTGILPSFIQKFEESEVVVSVEDQRKYEITKIKDRVVIPRKLYRPGATYRVDDTYYDSDGEFLYRVPGMIPNR